MSDAHFNIANIYLERAQFPHAITHYRQALEIRPTWEKALRGLEQAETAQQEQQGPAPLNMANLGPKSPVKPPLTTSANLDRQIDPLLHGELLRTLHRVTVDSENQGRVFLKALEGEIEPVIKELSSCLLYADHPTSELNDCLRRFEAAIQNMRSIHEILQTSMERVRLVGEQIIRT